MTPLVVLDLFCGCGGLSTGFIQAGFNVAYGIDCWNVSLSSFSENHKNVKTLCCDLSTLDPHTIPAVVDVIIGGPPCQGFSLAGKRDTKDPRNSLFMDFIRFVNHFRPKICLMENVSGILSMKNASGEYIKDIIIKEYDKINYDVVFRTLNAADFGVPQNRRRVFFLAKPKDFSAIHLKFPDPIIKCPEDRVAVRNVLEPRETISKNHFLSEKALSGIRAKRQRMVDKGYGFGAQFLDIEKPSYTIPCRYWHDGYDALVKYDEQNVRRLTLTELAKIQTFPVNYKFSGSKKDVIIQIGNAVPCLLGFHLAKCIQEILLSK